MLSFYFCSVYDVIYKDDKLKETGVHLRLPENSPDNVFFVINLCYIPMVYQWFYFRVNYTFPRFQVGPTFSLGVELFPPNASFYRNPYAPPKDPPGVVLYCSLDHPD